MGSLRRDKTKVIQIIRWAKLRLIPIQLKIKSVGSMYNKLSVLLQFRIDFSIPNAAKTSLIGNKQSKSVSHSKSIMAIRQQISCLRMLLNRLQSNFSRCYSSFHL